MSPSKWAPMPERNRRFPYETAGLKSGVFSGAFPFFHQTFLPVWVPWADAARSLTAPPAAIVAPFRMKFLLPDFLIRGSSNLSLRVLRVRPASRSDVSERTTPPVRIHPSSEDRSWYRP